ncbi:rCG36895 [Rattus norvegicus]|uniref:RCG36895 n=1 Tax=Rattus norvegicus TaxID=10116 RepID=A6HUJ1_RAT|nr:rCG36895 [Rattus norvegicus]
MHGIKKEYNYDPRRQWEEAIALVCLALLHLSLLTTLMYWFTLHCIADLRLYDFVESNSPKNFS